MDDTNTKTDKPANETTPVITKDMIISDIINTVGRDAALMMMEHGLHCVSCHVAAVETLEQGMTAHGYSEEDLDMLLKDLNILMERKAKKPDTNDATINKIC